MNHLDCFHPPPSAVIDFLHACQVGEEQLTIACSRMVRLGLRLQRQNQQYNLTRLTNPEQFWYKHVSDSMALVKVFPELARQSLEIADIGCGGGFPLFPLACFVPRWRLTGIEATRKKVEFLQRTVTDLQLSNVTVVHQQSREAGRSPNLRGCFDMITARAVGTASRLLRDARLLLKPGCSSRMILYKTPVAVLKEQDDLQRECQKFGFVWRVSSPLRLPSGAGERQFIVIMRD